METATGADEGEGEAGTEESNEQEEFSDELEQLLAEQPIGRLHSLARGRIHRHFRLGKRRLIEALLRHSAENRVGLESHLKALIEEAAHRTPQVEQAKRPRQGFPQGRPVGKGHGGPARTQEAERDKD